ncbi:hypothetical protein PIB30_039141 [Stylosanthes scabra]|uniref:Tryptophan synthase beta chain-like PALP domain-containing protein n=1 Tax=Stylosanthes scabra TaxID=79078 RepID=A0ABU6TGD1_9FABA|nr:hypothetical protein [Stylosanthes scabra]
MCKAPIAIRQRAIPPPQDCSIHQINPIVDHVRTRGDAAVKDRYTWKFEKAKLDKAVEVVSGGGTAVLLSRLSVPAHIAGCKTIVLATPPSQDGTICKEVLYCAKKVGVTHILKSGGAQV